MAGRESWLAAWLGTSSTGFKVGQGQVQLGSGMAAWIHPDLVCGFLDPDLVCGFLDPDLYCTNE